jgi:hypothetical protein
LRTQKEYHETPGKGIGIEEERSKQEAQVLAEQWAGQKVKLVGTRDPKANILAVEKMDAEAAGPRVRQSQTSTIPRAELLRPSSREPKQLSHPPWVEGPDRTSRSRRISHNFSLDKG